MKPSQINVKYRGGFKGSFICIQLLIERKVCFDVVDFTHKDSCVRDCEKFCYMQIRIGGMLCVTWHASEVLTGFLEDCKAEEQEGGQSIFPIEDCIVTVGEDRAYYLIDAPADALRPTDADFDDLVRESKRYNRRR
ncbi:MAG: hypothetical protein J6I31_08885 [Prevotella sp.]|nr:hypothetical protein [Prevotella sp.]